MVGPRLLETRVRSSTAINGVSLGGISGQIPKEARNAHAQHGDH
jgi:hypothetical protein